MDDKELLEVAAKAAGIILIPCIWNKGTKWEHEGFTVDGDGPNEWNALEDDGQALRLAVALEITVLPGIARDGEGRTAIEKGDDVLAATRRAIVKVAAEIGQSR